MTSLIDFYKRHGISPVRQDISNLEAHFTRRAGLYRHLGILPLLVRGRTVLEIGPGSGFNSLYTAALEPKRYVLLEGNPAGIADIERLFADFSDVRNGLEIVCELLDDYTTADRFDLVLCEGVLGLAGVADPAQMLKRIATFVEAGGLLVITCIDALSDLPETLRRVFAQLIIRPGMPLDEQVKLLMPVFSPHLSTLAGMSRRHDDWIVDNLLNPASIGPVLAIPDAIAALTPEFEAYGASPHYCADWRWYKSLVPGSERFNEVAIDQYWRNAHNLIDHREVTAARDPQSNRTLYMACVQARDLVNEYEHTRDAGAVNRLAQHLDAMGALTQPFSSVVTQALLETAILLAQSPLNPVAIATARHFGPWFGRGQQYLSFTKR